MVSAISKRRRIISPNAFFNKDIEMLYSLCLKASFAKIKPYSHMYQLSQFSKTLLLHYHENLSLVVVLRVRNCTHGCVPGYSNVQITTRRCTARRRRTPTTTPTECHRSTALWECVRLWRGPALAESFRYIVVNSVLHDDDCRHGRVTTIHVSLVLIELDDVTLYTMLVMWSRCTDHWDRDLFT